MSSQNPPSTAPNASIRQVSASGPSLDEPVPAPGRVPALSTRGPSTACGQRQQQQRQLAAHDPDKPAGHDTIRHADRLRKPPRLRAARRSGYFTAMLLGLVATAPGCGLPRVSAESSEVIEVSAEGLCCVEAETHTGNIEARPDAAPTTAQPPWPEPSSAIPLEPADDPPAETASPEAIEILVRKRASAFSEDEARRAVEAIDVRAEVEHDTLRVYWQWREEHAGWTAQVDYQILPPPNLQLDLKTHNGSVTVRGPQAPVEARTHNGRIAITEAAADVLAETHNGSVDVSGTPRAVELKAHNGTVRAELATSGPLDGVLQTHNGAVHLRLAATADAQIEAQTRNGTVIADLDGFESSQVIEPDRHEWRGIVGEGVGHLHLETHNGLVRLSTLKPDDASQEP